MSPALYKIHPPGGPYTIEMGTGAADRAGYLGGSDAAVIAGTSPYQTRMGLFATKKGINRAAELPPDKEEMFWFGHEVEPLIAARIQQLHGLRTTRCNPGALYRSTAHPFMAGHPDFLIGDDGAVQSFLECKNIRYPTPEWGAQCDDPLHDDAGDRVPQYYYAQCLHYMVVLGVSYCYLGALFGGCEVRMYRLPYDETHAAQLITAELEFWNQLLADDPPWPTSAEDYLLRFQFATVLPSEVQRIELDEEEVARVKGGFASKREAKRAEEEYNSAREWAIIRAQGFPAIFTDSKGNVVAKLTKMATRAFDAARMQVEQPAAFAVYQQYAKRKLSKSLRLGQPGKKEHEDGGGDDE